jgi:hypothetical protein
MARNTNKNGLHTKTGGLLKNLSKSRLPGIIEVR